MSNGALTRDDLITLVTKLKTKNEALVKRCKALEEQLHQQQSPGTPGTPSDDKDKLITILRNRVSALQEALEDAKRERESAQAALKQRQAEIARLTEELAEQRSRLNSAHERFRLTLEEKESEIQRLKRLAEGNILASAFGGSTGDPANPPDLLTSRPPPPDDAETPEASPRPSPSPSPTPLSASDVISSTAAVDAARIAELSETVKKLTATNSQLLASWTEAENKRTQVEASLELARAEIKQLQEQLAAVQEAAKRSEARAAKAVSQAEEERKAAAVKQQQIAELEKKLALAKEEAAETLRSQQGIVRSKNTQIEALEAELAQVKAALQRNSLDREALARKEAELQKAQEDHKEALMLLHYEKTARERERAQRQAELEVEKQERDRIRADAEREIARLNDELQSAQAHFEAQLKSYKQQVLQAESKEAAAVKERDEARAELERERTLSQQRASELKALLAKQDKLVEKHKAELEELERHHSERYEQLLGEAREYRERTARLIEEQNAKLQEAQEKIAQLEEEIATGKPSERRLMELAQLQARRDEAVHKLTMELEEQKKKVIDAQAALERKEEECKFLADQVKQLTRSRSRAAVNLDYLKSVLVRFIQFENRPAERKALIPVIATIMQFDDEDLEAINKAHQQQQQSRWLSKLPFVGSPASKHAVPDGVRGVSFDPLPLSNPPTIPPSVHLPPDVAAPLGIYDDAAPTTPERAAGKDPATLESAPKTPANTGR